MTIRGLHSCQKKNTPYIGDVKTFLIEERVGQSGKKWIKIKSAPADQGGRPYEVMSVAATDYSDAHGNVSFNLEIEPQNAPQTHQEAPGNVATGGGYEDRGHRIERQHSQHMAIQYAVLKGLTEITPKDMMALIDWFQRDVGRVPTPPKSKARPEPAGIIDPEVIDDYVATQSRQNHSQATEPGSNDEGDAF
jgi:hypothetical protein